MCGPLYRRRSAYALPSWPPQFQGSDTAAHYPHHMMQGQYSRLTYLNTSLPPTVAHCHSCCPFLLAQCPSTKQSGHTLKHQSTLNTLGSLHHHHTQPAPVYKLNDLPCRCVCVCEYDFYMDGSVSACSLVRHKINGQLLLYPPPPSTHPYTVNNSFVIYSQYYMFTGRNHADTKF